MKTTENNLPSAARLSRVTDILISSGDKYAGLVLNPDVPVTKRDGTTLKFTSAVIAIAQSIASMGKDACTCTKVMILDQADSYLGAGETTVAPDVKPVDAKVPLISSNEAPRPSAEVKKNKPEPTGLSSNFAIFSLLSMALNLANKYDTDSGSEDRKSLLSSVTEKYRVLLP